jgi:hypothetical protein
MIWDTLTQWNTPTEQVFAVQHLWRTGVRCGGLKLNLGGLMASRAASPRRT